MSGHWADIPGITVVAGRPHLPRRPQVVAAVFEEATRQGGAATLSELVDAVARMTGADRTRVEGLAGWLPVSRVARWAGDTGKLLLHPQTSARDLALRYCAWVGARSEAEEHTDLVHAYAKAITSAVDSRRPVGERFDRPWKAPTAGEATAEEVRSGGAAWTDKLDRILTTLDRRFMERSAQLRSSLLALLSGQHLLLLGPPGTAKSMLARALCQCFSEARYFEYLLSRFTHPDELFGPVSIPGLREEDYRRLTEGFLPGAHVAFLDEIFKANSAILNSLLTLINERVFHHGRHRDEVPLIGLVGASNELPDASGGLDALYDRFLVRLSVPPLGDADAFLRVATGSITSEDVAEADRITESDRKAILSAAARVRIGPEVRAALVSLWRSAAEEEWKVSDRRWRQAVQMLRVAAAAEGRDEVALLDLMLLGPVLAPEPSLGAEIAEIILEHVGRRAVPEHDLRAQWTLLQLDRVAPAPGGSWTDRRPGDFDGRLELRRENTRRLIKLANSAVSALAVDRRRVERGGGTGLWIDRVPSQVLTAHIEAARDLSHVLELAERYLAELKNPVTVAAALVQSLEKVEKREYAHGGVVRLRVEGVSRSPGLTLQGERIEIASGTKKRAPRHVSELEHDARIPEIKMSAREFIGWLRNEIREDDLFARLPSWGRRNASQALATIKRKLGDTGIPRPPRWDVS